jgi:peptide-methionine (S)-S-oxide reductase
MGIGRSRHQELIMIRAIAALVGILMAAGAVYFALHREPKETSNMTAVQPETTKNPDRELATLAGGCFWCLEAVFEQLKGVIKVESGYAGGKDNQATYKQVCEGDTGHAEVVQVTFDSKVISFKELLEVFFVIHDPTTINRQGGDVGTQYRSAVFFHSPEQEQTAREVIVYLTNEKVFEAPIVTEVVPLTKFFKAEDYHQGYFRTNPNQPYCAAVVGPKVAKFRKKFLEKLKP